MPDQSPTAPSRAGGLEAVHRVVIAEHRDVLAAVRDRADDVAAAVPTPTTDVPDESALDHLLDVTVIERGSESGCDGAVGPRRRADS